MADVKQIEENKENTNSAPNTAPNTAPADKPNEQTQPNEQAQNNDEGNKVSENINKLLSMIPIDTLLKNEEVAKKVQSIADQRVTQALNTAKGKWEAEATKPEAVSTEVDAARKALDEERAAFEAEKASYEREARLLKAAKQLTDAGLPDLADFVVGASDEATASNIAKLGEILNGWKGRQIVRDGSLEAPKDTTPQKALTLDEIKGMSEAEINERWDEIQEVLKKA